MDVSPIQRLAIHANQAARPVQAPRGTPAVTPPAQAAAASADQEVTQRNRSETSTRVVVAWHPSSLGYVTQVVDQHSGIVFMQTPPEQVLRMVQQIMKELEGGTA